jgi:hypothetical protein
MQWFPYSDSSIQTFKWGEETKSATIINSLTTKPFQTTTGMLGASGDCNATKTFTAQERDTAHNPMLYINLHQVQPAGSDETLRDVEIWLQDQQIFVRDLVDNAFQLALINNVDAQVQYRKKLQLAGRQFNRVQKIFRDTLTSKAPGIFEVYIVHNIGLAAYRTYPNQLWMLQL